jgi:hypothetical protein
MKFAILIWLFCLVLLRVIKYIADREVLNQYFERVSKSFESLEEVVIEKSYQIRSPRFRSYFEEEGMELISLRESMESAIKAKASAEAQLSNHAIAMNGEDNFGLSDEEYNEMVQRAVFCSERASRLIALYEERRFDYVHSLYCMLSNKGMLPEDLVALKRVIVKSCENFLSQLNSFNRRGINVKRKKLISFLSRFISSRKKAKIERMLNDFEVYDYGL